MEITLEDVLTESLGCWEPSSEQSNKWTTEGAMKAAIAVSILQRSIYVKDEECVGILREYRDCFCEQGGTTGFSTCP
ncbi:MAG: hypothetical protein PHQ45_05950 [Acidaminococcaceae bacterium]|nr:hypothetical protein [Acidaminococcaceae bacterium]